MPIYEYRCKECAHDVEVLQKLSDPPLVTCPACGKDALQKLVSAAGFQLKGSGWYVTDFRGGGSGAKKAPTGTDKPDAPATDGAKSETKTEAKSETTSESTTKSESATPAAPSSGSSGSSES